MNTKLTLNLKKDVIESAKGYAKDNNVSLSKLIENYLSLITRKNKNRIKVSPLVESLTGVILNGNEADNKNDYYEYLNEKYL